MDDLEDLYREIILDHYRSPRNRGELAQPAGAPRRGVQPALRRRGRRSTSTCDDGAARRHQGRRAGLLDLAVVGVAHVRRGQGQALDEVREVIARFKANDDRHERRRTTATSRSTLRALGELAALQGVVKFPVRIKCATLAWNTLAQGLDEAGA